ncbi:Fc receptor-like protein 5 isoform X1 [Anabas testudineus]|uniref:Fc receptor-like protein 5 isoform X1 n=1 Tax=Anabas testudineus TaxID=64144 RepID=UPI00143CD7C0|nr:Fc receptor-like protein 5 isoform X1 [Anabas testudineus]XP_033182493.1 Fc receptor-like protein 5 isoform X1 [Anabas testudineus]
MKTPALCFRQLIVSLLLVAQLHFSYSLENDAVFPQVVPNRQQHFEYETFTVSCEGLNGRTGWRVMRKIKDVTTICASTWETSRGPCEIKTAYRTLDSGEYWCEMKGVKRSKTVTITITAASVILESPALPVMEGDDVTLSCRMKQTPSNLTAEFYKDGFFMESSSTGEMIIQGVSTSDEGLYKCSISGAGESPESRLTVTASVTSIPKLTTVAIVSTVLCVAVVLLLVGLRQCRKRKGSTEENVDVTYSVVTTERNQNVSRESDVSDPNKATYAVVACRNKVDSSVFR